MKLSSLIAGPAAVIVLLAFFMPWITVECSGEEIEKSSGYEIATGSSDVNDSQDYDDDELSESDSYLWIIPVIALGVGIVALLRYGSVIGYTTTAVLYGVGALVALFAHLAEYMDIQDAVGEAEKQLGEDILTVNYQFGWWLSILGLMAILASAYLAYQEQEEPYRAPISSQPPRGPYF